MKNRLEALKKHLGKSWGELADYIGISRSMLDFVRTGEREPGNKTRRLIEEAEQRCGLSAPKEIPTFVDTPPSVGIPSYLEKISDSLSQIATTLTEIKKLLTRLPPT